MQGCSSLTVSEDVPKPQVSPLALQDCEDLPKLKRTDRALNLDIIQNRKDSVVIHKECMERHRTLKAFLENRE